MMFPAAAELHLRRPQNGSNGTINFPCMKRLLELRQQVGQLLIMGFDGASVTPSLRKMLRELQPAGVILFMRNVESPRQVHALLRDCRKLSDISMFLFVDMEGGTVDRLKKIIVPAPAAADVFHSKRREHFRRDGLIHVVE